MNTKTLIIAASTLVLASSSAFIHAADQEQAPKAPATTQPQPRIYGSQLMTPQERTEYRLKMRTAKTAEERQQIRAEHHERIKVRAQERGVTLPDDPPAVGGGMGPGGGMGGGMGGNRGR